MKAIIKNKLILNEIYSASAIELIDNELFIIGDNSPFLFILDLEGNIKNKIKIFDIEIADNQDIAIIPKKEKPDFEASCVLKIKDKNYLFVVGSGSSEKRNIAILVDLATFEVKNISLKKLYQLFIKLIKLTVLGANTQNDDLNSTLNIEGLCANETNVYFFQRGNISGDNFIFSILIADMASYLLSAKQTINIFKINRQKVTLPSINGIFSGFSGACFAGTPPISKHDRTILWTSSVEDTKNAIDDGSVLGSFLGTYDLDNHQIKSIIIENPVTDEIFMGKVEGVCVVDWSNDLSPKHVIAVTDADGGCSEMLFIEIS